MTSAIKDVWIGYDPREDEAYRVCQQSLIRRTSIPLDIHALRLDCLSKVGLMQRKQDRHGYPIMGVDEHDQPIDIGEVYEKGFDYIDGKNFSTEFAFTRFLVPQLQRDRHQGGWALFCDCDFMFNVDVAELFALADDKYAVMVVKHDFNPPKGEKMDHQTQENYYRKNWSSLVLWNTDHPANQRLTVTKVNEEMGRYLHSFMWLKDDEIGELEPCWNHLVGYTEGEPKVLHWTDGGPWFDGMEDCKYNELWFAERDL